MSFDPELYALVHDGAPGDVELYRDMARGARRVLELGSGWGRMSLALAQAGHEVVGLELDDAMIALAERHRAEAPAEIRARLRYVRGDMSEFSLGERFDRVFVPFTGLYCLLDEESVLGCLRSAAAHLEQDGLLVFDGYAADQFHEDSRPEDYPDDQLEEVAKVVHRGAPLTVLERSTWDRDRQRMLATYVYVDAQGEVVHEGSIGHRYLLWPQVEPLLAAAGLRLERALGSFEGVPFGEGGSLIVVARRA